MHHVEFTSEHAKTRRFAREPVTTRFERLDDTIPVEVIELPEPEPESDRTEQFPMVQYLDIEVYDPRAAAQAAKQAEDSQPYDLVEIWIPSDSEPYERVEIEPIAKGRPILQPILVAAMLAGAFALGVGAAFAM